MIVSPAGRLLIADDDADLLEMLELKLSDRGYQIRCVNDARAFRSAIEHEQFDAVLLDLHFGEDTGLELLRELQTAHFVSPVIIITAHGSIETAVEAMRLGAHDFVTKPPIIGVLDKILRKVISDNHLQLRAGTMAAEQMDAGPSELPMLGVSRKMMALRQIIAEAAPSNATVLVLGESGTGKELVAQSIHRQSRRSTGTFVPVNMAAVPAALSEAMLFGHEKGSFTGADVYRRGWCEQADQGTLFLDEIGEMDISLQAKLLRFLQERQIQPVGSTASKTVDVRIIAATNRNPLTLVREGRLRDDLYYRLNVIPIEVPPLRERRDDIPLLAMYFLRRMASENSKPVTSFSRETLDLLEAYDWPGNVRQLENLIQRLVILSSRPQISVSMLPTELLANAPKGRRHPAEVPVACDGLKVVDRLEKQAILDALQSCQGNVGKAGNLLGMGQATIYRKIKRYEIALKDRSRTNVKYASQAGIAGSEATESSALYQGPRDFPS